MNATGTITMTMREVDRFKVIQAVTEARLKALSIDDLLATPVDGRRSSRPPHNSNAQ
ncbi:hypothetical protein [Paraburkholderia diazotrophica]|uniref:hypothetical protein n=1 Tax=Paraburkholderia diazotrophica TaxID=667676 RepID=UPI0031706600